MVTKIIAAIAGYTTSVFRSNPVVSAAVIRIAAALLSRIGLRIHGNLFTAIVIVLAVVLAIAVQASVTPNVKLKSAGENVGSS